MEPREHWPGERAEVPGAYEELDVLGTPTGRIVLAAQDEELPAAPRGFSWRPLSEQSAAEIRARAEEYRRMAESARTLPVRESLRKLAERLDAIADRREQEERGKP
jgi:hypothetical protein